MVAFFEVSHLPSSVSFYSAVFQPLGLFYISTEGTGSPNTQHSAKGRAIQSQPTITYGTSAPSKAVFQIREVPTPKRSHATLSASSSQAVADFEAFAIRAHPASIKLPHQFPEVISTFGGSDSDRTRIRDLDGNIMDVVHLPSSHQSVRYGDGASNSGIPTTESHRDDASRILDWNYDVALSEHHHDPARSATGGPTSTWAKQPGPVPDKEYTVLRRSVTTSILEQPHRENGDSGLSSTTIVGALLGAAAGAAAGAALTYSLVKAERERAPRQEQEVMSVQRRATFPDGMSMTAPADGRYVEVERTVERIRYPESYAPLADHQQPSRQLPQYTPADNALTSGTANDYCYEDPHGHQSWQVNATGTGSVYSGMDGLQSAGAPLMIMDAEQHSTIGSSRHSTVRQPSVHGTVYETDRESFVSAQSKRSVSTIRGPPPPTVETELSMRSRAPSMAPSRAPSMAPSMAPSRAPSMAPSRAPSMDPQQGSQYGPQQDPQQGSQHGP
ncbi:hypothetical protein SODALDRAFT_21208 [Sodiomyces alkalinus F11]|uniref:VOC domain-containing protein n=1 Tax=Sodiomyces alkalinus (strain CBS 110278 / VKM F-3762 / F11) TaxID=1314773 RepID=A0A3N2Q7P0_SODAK|nr:hypothetical protein SODALDRAFT_21208 [Sodiomyces alkalinus F11]ROT42697.1 hypothetical protein SODALDRAFT_21208 [Sodiomyces alkalinus F11]